MIKFFRKIRQDLLSGGKSGKYLKYAIGEIVLVVMGILIALQVNNWNENRKNSNKGVFFLQSLSNDLEDDLVQIDSIYKFRTNLLNVYNLLLDKTEHIDKENKQYIDSLYTITQGRNPTFFPTVGAYSSATNTGTFENLTNENLKKAIRTLYERYYKRILYNGEILDKRVEKVSWERRLYFSKIHSKILSIEAIKDREFIAQLEYLQTTNFLYKELLEEGKKDISKVKSIIIKELKK
ncbi:DUF6090 family protein [uncultured Maribacter sp.]|uniref:DUF6090 family protein n=1 Tax=uncultured Maribacter sp. TaxID=431308 RepID=UPI0030DB284C|tara:strand:+ start:3978 stop:4688 length:711 start_codon:yes stop_codon:yes gene_type:complete